MVDLVFLNHIIIYTAIAVGIANVCLLSGLVYFYLESYKQLKSKFTTGLLYFSTILLIENVLAILALAVFSILGVEIHEIGGTGVYFVLLLVNIAQLIALAILFKITWD
ncbi:MULTISPECIES: hypothetical protein [Methanobacterium]|jgi:hypothetical protein|uniref:Uncharacterized protein n=1 Tax=Methanobacterium bryantii TaxID=2161 RepID=A0A2A2H676_METBR|nr:MULTISPECIES: hypothetical protein [Methanobacterium]OEC84516.1 hypothetical protein A9507_01775 [Methanobacterium sp. A39]PAV04816.1 hypothetical protein ASJ80_10920 [Methanobacterium bryantii]